MHDIIIVDDEPIISNGLINFIDWADLECRILCSAENGFEAVERIKEKAPDIVITDIKMPGLDGIELSKFLYENYPSIKVIILTGYADFSYAQSAIKFGVVDFVLKPAFTEKIIEAVNKAKKVIHEQRERENKLFALENQISDIHPEIQEKFLLDLINSVLMDSKTISLKSEQLKISISNFYVLVFQVERADSDKPAEDNEAQNKFILAVRNFLSLAFKDYSSYSIFISGQVLSTVLSFQTKDNAENLQNILLKCEEILSIVNNYMQFSISIGISNMHKKLDEISLAYSEATNSLSGRFYDESSIFIYPNYPSNRSGLGIQEEDLPFDKISEFIHQGKHIEAVSSMESWLENQKKLKHSIDHIKSIGIQICSICSKILGNYNLSISDVLCSGDTIYKQVFQCNSISHLKMILTGVITSTSSCISSSQRLNNYIIKKATEYIKDNYSKNIKLNSIAKFVHVNSSYLSRIFRKETGETITEVINRLRIEKAKELLSKNNIKTYEVASLVGIDDSTYFSQVFKKYAGMSPTEYKHFK